MSLRLYMDVNIPLEITKRLQRANVDVLRAQDDGGEGVPDSILLRRATALGRSIFTHDQDFLALATTRLNEGIPFCCVFFAHHDPSLNGIYAQWLEMYATLGDPEEYRDRVVFIP